MVQSFDRVIQQSYGPLNRDLATPVNTKPATAVGVFNNTVGTAAEKVLSAATVPAGKVRRVKIFNPTSGVMLGYTTATKGAAAPTLTSSVAGGGATNGSPIPAFATEWFSVDDSTDLYLAASAAASPYSLTISEI